MFCCCSNIKELILQFFPTELQERKPVKMQSLTLTSGTKEAPANVDRRGEEAVPLGATTMAAADHDVMRENDAASRHTVVSCVIGYWTADTAHQTTCTTAQGEGKEKMNFYVGQVFCIISHIQ